MNDPLVPLYFFGTIIFLLFAVSFPLFVVFYTQSKARNRLLHENELMNTRLEVQEESMTLISEELHDNITQSLGTIKRYIAGAEHAMPESREKEHLRKAKQIITNVIKEVRHISHSLNSELIENAGLHEVLQKNLEYISESSQIECRMDIKGTAVPLAREQNLLVYRIFQEAMHNITKHAGADKAKILFEYTTSELMITIEDNGKGFDAEMAQNRESLGLRNIATRAKILHGDLTIRSQLGLGSSLTLNFPINS